MELLFQQSQGRESLSPPSSHCLSGNQSRLFSKSEPNDVDVFLLMDDSFDVKMTTGDTRLMFDHSAAQDRLGASVFWLRKISALEGESAAINQWAT
jgi:hypothetical protein